MNNAPPQLIELAVEAKTKGDIEKMSQALARLATEDPPFGVSVDGESGRTVITGTNESDLEFIIDRLKREFKVDVIVGARQAAYRETIRRTADVDYTHKKRTGVSAEFARVKVRFEPLPPGSGFEFQNEVVGGNLSTEYICGVEKGLRGSLDNGVLAGFPVIDFKATLYDGAYQDVDSSVLAFEIAARAAFKQGILQAGPTLLEPLMRVEVTTPEDYVGEVIGDLNSRRGQVTGIAERANAQVIRVTVPLANVLGYGNFLHRLSGGRATFTTQFSHYELLPGPEDPPFPPAAGMRA